MAVHRPSKHVPDSTTPRPRPHHWVNADGTCHAGDLFEQGTPSIALYTAEELVRIVNAEKAEAFDAGMLAFSQGRGSDANLYREWGR